MSKNKIAKLILSLCLLLLPFFVKVPTASGQDQQAIQEIYDCIGKALAEYMNAVIDGAGNLRNIRLLSPAFNMTSPHFNGITNAMAANGARFRQLDGIAGNAYNISGKRITAWAQEAMSNPAISGLPLMLTETGTFDGNIPALREELLAIKGGSAGSVRYLGALLFNAFNTNSSWATFSLTDDQIQTACGGSCGTIGVNSAAFYSQPAEFYSRAQNLGMKHTLEIATNNPEAALAGIKEAHSRGMIPVIRIGVGTDSGGFSNPDDYVAFLKAIDSQVSSPVYAIAGPNEPESEPWAAPDCALLSGPLISPRCSEIAGPGGPPDSNEFHSLRPYPHAPCDPAIWDTALMCANQLIVKEALEVRPDSPGVQSCRANADGTQTCTFKVQSQVRIHVNLDNAELPILGNTELVPNSQNPSDSLPFKERVNEYVSWYLNGVNKRAEEDEIDEKSSDVVTFAGPLRKLLPWSIQTSTRVKQINDAQASRYENAGIRHDQIAGCSIVDFLVGHDQAHCYFQPTFLGFGFHRLTGWLLSGLPPIPPIETGSGKLIDFIEAYQRWRGYIAGIPSGAVNWWARIFDFIPFSSTEDRKGRAQTRNPGETTRGTPGVDEMKISDIFYEREPFSTEEILYFAHMEETAQLANLLQGTYSPANQSRTSNTKNESIAPEIRPGCVILETRSNRGDSLWAEYNEPEPPEKPIASRITYTATFDCKFGAGSVDQACVENNFESGLCKTFDECQQQCTRTPTCKRDAVVAVPMETETPKIEEIWNRLVEGDMAVFKRIFPKFGPQTPIVQPKDLPTVTQGSYSTEKISGPDSTLTTLAGHESNSRPGDSAEIYFPHIGALKEYFLNGIQDALRPKGFGQTTLSGSSEVSAAIKPGKCSEAPAPYCSVENLSKFFPNKEAATNASQICNKESGGNPNAKNLNCTSGRGPDYSIGLFQINLLAHCPGAFSDYSIQPPYSCTIANQERLQECVTEFSDPENNIQKAVELSNGGTNWRPWLNAARACSIIQ